MDPSNTGQPEVNVIFGASGDIGAALCRLLASRGSRLFLTGRDPSRLGALASELQAPSQTLDGQNSDEFGQCLAAAKSEHGEITGVVNCIGSVLLKPAHRTTPEEWNSTLMTNLGTAFATVQAAAKSMRHTGGSVVLISSSAALTGLPNHEAIAAAKAGINGLARSAAATYASSGLRFNAVAPGLVRTRMTKHLWSGEAAAAGSIAMHPLGRLGEPEDVASLIAWLLERNNDWVTGQVIAVDGGLAQVRGRAKR